MFQFRTIAGTILILYHKIRRNFDFDTKRMFIFIFTQDTFPILLQKTRYTILIIYFSSIIL
jgi:hypothetical protein